MEQYSEIECQKRSILRQAFIKDCLSNISVAFDGQAKHTRTQESKAAQQRIDCSRLMPGGYLTVQEARCIKHLLDGCTYRKMAVLMGLSVRTVEFYMNNIKKKFNIKKKSEVINFIKNAF